MTFEPSSPNSVTTTNSTPSFARRHWQQIIWLIVAIVGIICIVSLVFLASNPKTVPQEVQMQLMNVFFVVYIVGLVRSQFIYRLRGATFGSIHADERRKQQRTRYENRNSSSLNLSGYGNTFLSSIGNWIFSKLFWFFISGVTWPFIEAFVQLRYLISSDARRTNVK